MKHLIRLSLVDQTSAFLHAEILAGRWTGELPGVGPLAVMCGVSHPVMRAALLRLEEEGLVTPGGRGHPRMLTVRCDRRTRRPLRVVILLEVGIEEQDPGFQLVLLQMRLDLEGKGCVCDFARKTQTELGHDLAKIKRLVARDPADAWVVVGGMAETLEWFAGQPVPAIALGGRCREIAMASTGRDTLDGFLQACRHLIGLGHRRVVFIASREMRHPEPSRHVKALTAELAAHGAPAGSYNFPEWDETPAGLLALLERTFHLTPPTAILVQSTNWLAGLVSFLAQRRMRIPQDISIVSLAADASFAWWLPMIAHLESNRRMMADRIVRWVDALALGRADRECVPCQAVFVPGQSTGPVAR